MQKSAALGKLGGFWFFDEGFLADDDDAGISDVEAATVGFEVVAELAIIPEANKPEQTGYGNN